MLKQTAAVLRLNSTRQFIPLPLAVAFILGFSALASGRPTDKLFPVDVAAQEWTQFTAAGFDQPVAGIIFDSAHPTCCGVALGGLGTGCLDIETRGVLGFNCIFNPPDWPRGRAPQLLLPFLGLAVDDKVWVLATQNFIDGGTLKACTEPTTPFKEISPELTTLWQRQVPHIEAVRSATEIRYWGHYPVADLEYQTDAPIEVALRAWAPFIPGDALVSRLPGAVFEVHLRNPADKLQKGTLAFSFPGPNSQTETHPRISEDQGAKIFQERKPLIVDYGSFRRQETSEKGLRGVLVASTSEKPVSYFLGAMGDEKVRTGMGLAADPLAWSRIASQLPHPSQKNEPNDASPDSSAAVAVDFEVAPRQTKIIRFVLTWYAPHWGGLSYRCNSGDAWESHKRERWSPDPEQSETKREFYTAMYARDFANALGPARKLLQDHSSLLRRILAWQQAVYTDQTLPLWLRDCLVNNLNLLPENAYWAQPNPPVQWAAPLGAFGLDECPRGCSAMGCVVSNWYGDMPLTYFFPELERAILRDYMQYMRPDGAIALMFAAGDFTIPCYEWLGPLNASCFVDMVHRLWRRTGDDSILREFYPAVKKSTLYTMTMKPAPAGIISAPWVGRGQEWWEHTPVQGMVSHLGGVRLAQLRLAERLAEKMQDPEFAQQCRTWYQQGSELLEKNLWTGEYYLFFNDPENAKKSALIMSSQLDGDWSMFLNGMGSGVFAPNRATKALETIRKTCLVDCGLAGFADPNGKALLLEYGTFPPEINIVGMTYIYHGQRDQGLDIIKRNMDNMVRKQRHPWDLPNLLRCDDGRRTYGTDYFQNMALWTVPAALAGQDLTGPCQPGGLAARVLQAASAK